LYIYVKRDALRGAEVEAFLRYTLDQEREIAERALFISLTPAQLTRAKQSLEQALGGQ
jgi:hypothetical protein